MVEQRTPVRHVPPPRRPKPSPSRIAARRVIALVVLAGGLGLIGWLAVSIVGAIRDNGTTEAKAPVPVAPPALKIIFPEGFTRADMAARIKAVDGIARRKRKINPHLSSDAYLRLTASSKIPGKFAGDHKRRILEGFLFPSTY